MPENLHGQWETDQEVDAQVGQLASATQQPVFDLSSGRCPTQLEEQHTYKLALSRERFLRGSPPFSLTLRSKLVRGMSLKI